MAEEEYGLPLVTTPHSQPVQPFRGLRTRGRTNGPHPLPVHRLPEYAMGMNFTTELGKCSDLARLLPPNLLEKACEKLHYALARVDVARPLVESIPEVQTGPHLAAYLRAHSTALGEDAEAVIPQLQLWRAQTESLMTQPEAKVQERVMAVSARFARAPLQTDWSELAIRLSVDIPSLPRPLHTTLRGVQDATEGSV